MLCQTPYSARRPVWPRFQVGPWGRKGLNPGPLARPTSEVHRLPVGQIRNVATAILVPNYLRKRSGSLAIFAAIRLVSSQGEELGRRTSPLGSSSK